MSNVPGDAKLSVSVAIPLELVRADPRSVPPKVTFLKSMVTFDTGPGLGKPRRPVRVALNVSGTPTSIGLRLSVKVIAVAVTTLASARVDIAGQLKSPKLRIAAHVIAFSCMTHLLGDPLRLPLPAPAEQT